MKTGELGSESQGDCLVALEFLDLGFWGVVVGQHCQQIHHFVDLLDFQVGALLADELLERVVVEEGEGVDAVTTLD